MPTSRKSQGHYWLQLASGPYDFAHVSPNCSLSGNVRIGKFSHLGTGTCVHPGIYVGNNVNTGIGSKVFKNILDDTVLKN